MSTRGHSIQRLTIEMQIERRSSNNLQGTHETGDVQKVVLAFPSLAAGAKALFPRGYDAQGDSRERLRTKSVLPCVPNTRASTQTTHPASRSQPCSDPLPALRVQQSNSLSHCTTTGSQRSSSRVWLHACPGENAQQPLLDHYFCYSSSSSLLHVPCLVCHSTCEN